MSNLGFIVHFFLLSSFLAASTTAASTFYNHSEISNNTNTTNFHGIECDSCQFITHKIDDYVFHNEKVKIYLPYRAFWATNCSMWLKQKATRQFSAYSTRRQFINLQLHFDEDWAKVWGHFLGLLTQYGSLAFSRHTVPLRNIWSI